MNKITPFLFILILSGCAMTPRASVLATMQTATPLDVSDKKIAPVGVGLIEIRMKQKKIGNFHASVLPFMPGLPTLTYNSVLKLTPESQEGLKRLIEDDLGEAGYTVAGREQLFVPSDLDKARFLIGGEITDASWDGYDGFRGHQTIGNMQLEWQVYDTVRKTVIYKVTTEGKDWVQNSDGVGLTAKVISNALRNMLSQASFVAALSEASK